MLKLQKEISTNNVASPNPNESNTTNLAVRIVPWNTLTPLAD